MKSQRPLIVKDSIYNCYPLYSLLNTNGWPSAYQQVSVLHEIMLSLFHETADRASVLELFSGSNEHQDAFFNRVPTHTGAWDTLDKFIDTPNKHGLHFKQCVSEFKPKNAHWDLGTILFNGVESTLADKGVMRFDHLRSIIDATRNCAYLLIEVSGLNWSSNQGCMLLDGLTNTIAVPMQHPLRKLLGREQFEEIHLDYTTEATYSIQTGMTALKYSSIEAYSDTFHREIRVPPLNIRYWEPCQLVDAATQSGFSLMTSYNFNPTDNTLVALKDIWTAGSLAPTHFLFKNEG